MVHVCLFDAGRYSGSQANQQMNKAITQLTKLYRFNSAPHKVKLHLYKTLIRPILEYPPAQLASTSKKDITSLQKVQNKALRFVYDAKWHDFTTNETLHKRAKIDTIQERLHHLKEKLINKIVDIHFDNHFTPVYKLSDYTITDQPINPRSNKVRQCFQDHGFNPVVNDT